MKYLITTAFIFAATSASAEVSKVKVYDHTKTVTQSVPVSETRCQEVQVPIYQS
jgi:ASC-1-like (ASCH) protein